MKYVLLLLACIIVVWMVEVGLRIIIPGWAQITIGFAWGYVVTDFWKKYGNN